MSLGQCQSPSFLLLRRPPQSLPLGGQRHRDCIQWQRGQQPPPPFWARALACLTRPLRSPEEQYVVSGVGQGFPSSLDGCMLKGLEKGKAEGPRPPPSPQKDGWP